jgi:hypothetical protein
MYQRIVPIAALLAATAVQPVFAAGGLPLIASIQVGPHQAALHNDSPTLATGPNLISVELASLPAGTVISLTLAGPQGEAIAVPLSKVTVLDGPDGGHGGAEGAHADTGLSGHDVAPPADHSGMSAASHSNQPANVHAQPTPASSHDAMAGGMDHAAMGHGSEMPPAGQTDSAPAADVHGGASPDDHVVADAHDQAALHVANEAGSPGEESYLARGQANLPSTGRWIAHLSMRGQRGEIFTGQAPLEVVEGGPNRLYLGATGLLMGGSLLFGLIQRRRQSDAPVGR